MAKKLNVLQVGSTNWNEFVDIDETLFHWIFLEPHEIERFDAQVKEEEALAKKLKKQAPLRSFQVVLVEDINGCPSLEALDRLIEPYSVLMDSRYPLENEEMLGFVQRKMARWEDFSKVSDIVAMLPKKFFSSQYGDKMSIETLQIDPNFTGKIESIGTSYLSLEGEFSKEGYEPLASWVYSRPILTNQILEIWPEYLASDGCQVELELQLIPSGSVSDIIHRYRFTEEDLSRPVEIESPQEASVSATLWVKGKGHLKIGPLHVRFSRGEYGKFILGGQRLVDEKRQELFYYFGPGDLKPPLNVYFSGYRGAEGFEGYFMMKSFGAPFLLIADPRLEGGSFYLGSDELEDQVCQVIQKHLEFLGFTTQDLILSGLSMGTFGALYYGALLAPKAIIVGKPLVNVGSIAGDARFIRPQEFGTAFDVLQHLTGEVSEESVAILNQRFWKVFDRADLSDTQIAISYMRHDDYDLKAYIDILEHLGDKRTKVISKGIDGRHNDASPSIMNWFLMQYANIMKDYFGRDKKE